jgi:hypothetical protein
MPVRQPQPVSPVNTIVPFERCPDCKTKAPCIILKPPLPKYSSGFVCSKCKFDRTGGITMASGPRVVGYSYSNGLICWRCARDKYGGAYPHVPYLKGPIGVVCHTDKPLDRYCDECGVLVNDDC